MTTRRGFLGALGAFHCKLSGVDAATNYLRRSGAQRTVLHAHAEVLEAGNWIELSPAVNQTSVLTQSGASLSIYSNQVSWDQARKMGHFCGKRSGKFPIQHTVYRESTHDWITLHPDLSTPLGIRGHGYDYNIIDPATGRIFFKNFNIPRKVFFADPPDYTWSSTNALPLWPDVRGGNTSATPALFWSGPMNGVTNGAVVILSNGGGTPALPRWQIYDQGGGHWETPVPVPASVSLTTFEKVGDYSAIDNCAVAIVTVEGDPTDLYCFRLNSDRTVAKLTTPPRGAGYHSYRQLQNSGNFVCDPVTGHFLLLAHDGTFWELDALDTSGDDPGKWTQLPNGPSDLWPSYRKATICWAVPAYGVTAWATHKGDTWLYKHRLHSRMPRSSASGGLAHTVPSSWTCRS